MAADIIVTGAYGRDYTTAKKALEDWYKGKDFRITFGTYCSIRDFNNGESIKIRFNKLQDFVYVPK